MVRYQQDADYKRKIEKRTESSLSFICPKKHYVRMNGWVQAAKERKRLVSSRDNTEGYVRYFTLCGREAIDILLFNREDIIRSTERGYPDVCYCDSSHYAPLEYIRMREALGNTKGFNKKFEDLIDSEDFKRLIENEPFDIINLDFCGTCFPSNNPPYSSTLKSIERIMQLNCRIPFDLFLTFRAQRGIDNTDAIQQLSETMSSNFDISEEIRETYYNNVGQSLDILLQSDYPAFILNTIPKIILGIGARNHLRGECQNRYMYKRTEQTARRFEYRITKFIFSFETSNYEADDLRNPITTLGDTNDYSSSIKQYLSTNTIDVDSVMTDHNLKDQMKKDQTDLITDMKKFEI